MSPPNSHHHHSLSSASSSSYTPSVIDALYCEEEEDHWEESTSLLPILLSEDEELLSLSSKEQKTDLNFQESSSSPFYSIFRREAVEWMLKVNSYYDFSTLTAVLSVNYLDNFLYKSPHLLQHNKPWMIQLAAVTCLSLAAKFEETDVPLLLDLQVEGTKYMFEPKTIQKMELLVLSTLEWKMNPVTPISFFHHIIRRLGLKTHLHYEFLRRCEQLLLAIVADSRFLSYLPSVLATATMMHVIDQIQPSNPLHYHNLLLRVLNITKENVKPCYDLIVEMSKNPRSSAGNKRERDPSSPKGVMDAYYFSSDSSNESTQGGSSTSASVSSSPEKRALKKMKVDEQCMPLENVVGIALISIISYMAMSIMRDFVMEELQAFFIIFPLYLWKRY